MGITLCGREMLKGAQRWRRARGAYKMLGCGPGITLYVVAWAVDSATGLAFCDNAAADA
jgi:hypothetical protein